MACARWHAHVNHVSPPHNLRHWLIDTASLTGKLMMRSTHFRVRRLCQERALSMPDEFAEVGLARRAQIQQREVLLECDGTPAVFAHTVVPLDATAHDWPFFGTLGERSLGTTLFGDPRVARGRMQYARLHARHPLARRARQTAGNVVADPAAPLYARRCLYRRRNGLLLVTELFLPPVTALSVPHGAHPIERQPVR
jgi:chorismate--pyruvate lyase